MKVLLNVIMCLLTIGMISSCKKDIPEPDLEPQPFGEVNALVNGEKWEASYYYYHYANNYIRLSFSKYEKSFRRNSLTINNIPKQTGSYTLKK